MDTELQLVISMIISSIFDMIITLIFSTEPYADIVQKRGHSKPNLLWTITSDLAQTK